MTLVAIIIACAAVCARRARKMLAELAPPCRRTDDELSAMVEKVLAEESPAQRRFDTDTRDGEDERRQIEWEKRVAAELEGLKAVAPAQP